MRVSNILGTLSLLIDQFVVLCSESRKSYAVAITPLGYDEEDLKLWFLIIFHSRNRFSGYCNFGFCDNKVQPS